MDYWRERSMPTVLQTTEPGKGDPRATRLLWSKHRAGMQTEDTIKPERKELRPVTERLVKDLVRCCSAREFLAELHPGSVGMVATDPPWKISRKGADVSRRGGKFGVAQTISLDFGSWDYFESDAAYYEFMAGWMALVPQVLRAGGHLVMFSDIEKRGHLRAILCELGMIPRQALFWVKSNPAPRARKNSFMIALEPALWFTKPPKNKSTFNYRLGQRVNYVKTAVPHGARRVHPTQKPVEVWEVWLHYLTRPGYLVVDPFCGSGSTLVAAHSLGRRVAGCDLDPKYVAHTLQWLEETQAPLFDLDIAKLVKGSNR